MTPKEVRATHPAWKRQTAWDMLSEVAGRRAEAEALVTRDELGRERRLTYAELLSAVRSVSAGLTEIGVKPGDRVSTWMTNLVEYVITFFAVQRLGAVLVPVSTFLKPDEAAFYLRTASVEHLILMDRFRKRNFYELFGEMCPEWSATTPGALESEAFPSLRNVIALPHVDGVVPAHAYSFSDLLDPSLDALRRSDEAARSVMPEDLALIKFTSGSTSFPKGVMLEQWGIVTNAMLQTDRLGITENDRFFNARPMFHAGGSIWGIMTMTSRGGTLVFTEAWNPTDALDLLERERCTVNWSITAMNYDLMQLLKESSRDLSSMRISAAQDPLTALEVKDVFGVDTIFNPYGLTEAYGPDAIPLPDDPAEKQATTNGRFFDGLEVRVVDPQTGRDVPPGDAGECLIRGLVMRGYLDLPEQTARAIDQDGWLHTDDLVRIDPDGFVTFLGRLKAMIKVGGENVNVGEVEENIRSFPGIAECCVVGVPDPRKQEIGRAYFVVRTGHKIDAAALEAYLRERLAPFKVPRDFIVVDALPKTGTAKIDRSAVLRWAMEEPPAVGPADARSR